MLPNNHGRFLGLVGISLFAASLVNGFLVHLVGAPRAPQMLSAHLIGLIGSGFLLALSGIWPTLALPRRNSAVAVLLAVYGFVAGWLFNVIAGLTGAYGVFPISTQAPGGNSYGDLAMSAALLTVAICLLALSALLFRGLNIKRSEK